MTSRCRTDGYVLDIPPEPIKIADFSHRCSGIRTRLGEDEGLYPVGTAAPASGQVIGIARYLISVLIFDGCQSAGKVIGIISFAAG